MTNPITEDALSHQDEEIGAALVDDDAAVLGSAARDLDVAAGDPERVPEYESVQRLVPHEVVGIGLPVDQEVDDVNKARLALATPSLGVVVRLDPDPQ